ncbi:MAG: ornithine cyclodeaminase family protein [Actinomycetota bacterium]
MPREVLLLRRDEVRQVLDMASCIDAVERAFIAYSTGQAELPAVIHLEVPEHRGEIHVKAGHLHGGAHYAVKVASGFSDSTPPTIDGMVLVFDARTGAPAALLLDDGLITDVRTGAAGGVAARALAPEAVRTVGVLGTGLQARHQIEALACVRPGFGQVRVWGRSEERAQACANDLRAHPSTPAGCDVRTVESAQAAVEGADVVITCTASREPIVRATWLAPGSHVTAVGSDGADKQELDIDVLTSADLVAVDSRRQTASIGELHHAVDAGALLPEDVAELGEIASGARPGRISQRWRTVCDLTGVGVQDVVAAELVLERAVSSGLGQRIAL